MHQHPMTSITCQHSMALIISQCPMTPPVHQHTSPPMCQWAITPTTSQHMSPPACQQAITSIMSQWVMALITSQHWQHMSPPACQWATTLIMSQQVMTPPTSQQLMSNLQACYTFAWLLSPVLPLLHSHEGERIVESLGCQYLGSLLMAGKGLCQVSQISFLSFFLCFSSSLSN